MHGEDVVVSTVPRTPGGEQDVSPAVDAVQAFTAELFGRLASEPGNLVCSPYSVATALAMTRNGARGRTAEQMDAVLHVPALASFNAAMNALEQRLRQAGAPDDPGANRPEVAVASSLWGQRGMRWEPGFLDALARWYGAGMRQVDYRVPTAAASEINRWTSEQTHGRIPRLVPPEALDKALLVLVNAVYLRAAWAEPFVAGVTSRRPFTTSARNRVDADMMSGVLHHAGYTRGPGWSAARVPYARGQIAMAVVVPEAGVELRGVESALDGPGLARLLGGFEPVPAIRVELPRWTMRTKAALNAPLGALGMPDAFGPAADFSGMTTHAGLCIDKVLHEGFIAVDEAGTEAAAATGVIMTPVSLTVGPSLTLVADRAFLFVLYHVETAVPLFIGRVDDPTQ
ncbi:MAG: serpin family protein [Nocardioidaceae bacterium]